ncbi:MAG: transcriptional regulator [Pirellulaceae bacterium]|nr:transcriptional regulator [Pirellulaceae bacterium]
MTSPTVAAPTEELPKDVADLAAAIAALPAEHRSRIEPLIFRVIDSTKRRRRILNLVQEALSQLRLDMKYLVFDLEATRRERDALQHGDGDDHLRGEN